LAMGDSSLRERGLPALHPMAASVHPAAGPAAVRASKCSRSRARPTRWAGTCLTLAAFVVPAMAFEADPRFIFISSPSKRSILYAPLPTFSELSKFTDDRLAPKAQVLIDGNPQESFLGIATEEEKAVTKAEEEVAQAVEAEAPAPEAVIDVQTGVDVTVTTTPKPEQKGTLLHPEGLAMWHGKDKAFLYVADSKAHQILAYQITGTLDFDPVNPMKFGTIQAGAQQVVVKELNSVSGLALDGFGNLYFSTVDGLVGLLEANTLPSMSPKAIVLYTSTGQKNYVESILARRRQLQIVLDEQGQRPARGRRRLRIRAQRQGNGCEVPRLSKGACKECCKGHGCLHRKGQPLLHRRGKVSLWS